MSDAARFPFLPSAAGTGQAVFMPLLPLELRLPEGLSIHAHGLLDTGATINVLPFTLGLRVGAVWERQDRMIPLAGNLASQEARALLVEARIGDFGVCCCTDFIRAARPTPAHSKPFCLDSR